MTFVDDELRAAARAGLFTDAEELVACAGKVLAHERVASAPRHRYFDLASLTKPLCTGLLFMLSWQKNLVAPGDAVRRFLGSSAPQGVTLGALLNHTSGLTDWHDFFAELPRPLGATGFARNRRAIVNRILTERAFWHRPGKTVYSDLGYILISAVLEKIHGESLDTLYRRRITKPLRISDALFFLPSDRRSPSRSRTHATAERGQATSATRFIPSESCPRRDRLIQGEVMDENAWSMGGVSGHAGLFGTAGAIHRVLMELRQAREGKSTLITADTFAKCCRPHQRRKLAARYFTGGGFDTPTRPGSQAGSVMSASSIGHLGYSGTSFWWDLQRDAWIVLLTNRCHAGRNNRAFAEWRPKFHDAVMTRLNIGGRA